MRVLFDVVHPAHVHFFKHIARGLIEHGHEIRIVAREKEVTTDLLDHERLEYSVVGSSRRRSLIGHFGELIHRDLALAREARRFKAHVILTRNPAGVQAARLAGALGVFDTDDGTAVGLHFHAARPFAHIITTPDCFWEHYGPKHQTYPGYKQTAYLHPDHFTPDPGIRGELGVAEDERYFIVRFVALVASHDGKERGIPELLKSELIERLSTRGRVFVSTEGPIPDRWAHLRFPIAPHRMHHALAHADLLVGDSQTMAAEAAVLGTPALWVASFVGRVPYLMELEARYGLIRSFHPSQGRDMLECVTTIGADAPSNGGHARLLAEKCNVAAWYLDRLRGQWFRRREGAL